MVFLSSIGSLLVQCLEAGDIIHVSSFTLTRPMDDI